MDTKNPQERRGRGPGTSTVLFLASVLVVYGVLLAVTPDKGFAALKGSGNVFLNIVPALSLVFAVMLVLNLSVKPTRIARFVSKESGIKGVALSTAAGIISTGPIYAWYPLLKELKEKGATNSLLAIFLGNRAVKPFLLPVMVAYFGWAYALILTVLTVAAAIAIGYLLGALTKERLTAQD